MTATRGDVTGRTPIDRRRAGVGRALRWAFPLIGAAALLAFVVAQGPAVGAATPGLRAGDASVVEGTGTSKATIEFPITLDGPATVTTTVTWRTVDGTATAPSDYFAKASGTSTIRPGRTSTTARIKVRKDPFVEPSETFALQITGVTAGVTVADATGVGTIVNDDRTPPSLTVADVSGFEGDEGSQRLRVAIRVNALLPAPITVTWKTTNGEAVAPGDYRAETSGMTRIPKGKNVRDATIWLRGDLLAEGSEAFRFTITGVSEPGVSIGDGDALVTIVDDDVVEPAPPGSLWAWGSNTFGETGLGSVQYFLSPARVRPDTDWARISGGHPRTLAIKTDGSLWQWGSPSPTTPVRVGVATDWVAVSGGDPALAIKTDGTLWSWGVDSTVPAQVGSATDWRSAVSCFGFVLAIKTDDTLWAWGRNERYQLGLGDTAPRGTPTQVGTGSDWAEARCGYFASVARTNSGTLWAWGEGTFGQLGQGDRDDHPVPVQVGTRTDWVHVTSASYSNAAITADGHLFTWGFNGSGRLGLGDMVDRLEPTQVGVDTDWAAIDGGESSVLALRDGGTLWSWGGNLGGQLGLGDTTARLVPTRIGTGTNWARLSEGSGRFAIRG
jgi:hypothetical protein